METQAIELSRKRRYRTVEEKVRIVEETLGSEVSVAAVARRHGINANQLFHWRKLYQAGLLVASEETVSGASRLLAVTIADDDAAAGEAEASVPGPCGGAIHIEIPGRALVRVESGAHAAVVRAVLESLQR